MRLGFGITVWMQGLLSGNLDGIGTYTERLWREYIKYDIDIRAVGFGVSDDKIIWDVVSAPYECINGSYKAQAVFSLMSGLSFRGTDTLAKKIDVFHATDHHIPKLRGIPTVATIMDAIPFIHPEWASRQLRWAKNAAFKRTAQWAEHLITISEFSKHDIIDVFGIDEKKITVIPLGYDEAFKQRVEDQLRMDILHQYGLKDGYFIFVGTLQPRKNVRRIIDAHKALGSELQNAHPLVIVGNYGWGDDDLRHEIEQLEYRGSGRWLRCVSHDDLVALLQSAKAMVYPSLYEGFGLPILEGFAAGIPVISSNTTSIPEVAGDAALLINPLDTEELSYAMRKVVEDEDLVSNLVQRGHDRLKQFSWGSCAKHTLRVYESVM